MVSEQDQLLASKIAYADLNNVLEAQALISDEPVTLESALKYAHNHGIELGSSLKNCVDTDGTLKEKYSYANNWVIKSAINDNVEDGTGLYACIIDTGDSNILACRGSESMENILNYRQDWYNADLKLLNSVMTKQEAALLQYMADNTELLDSKPWVSTGHSLGGALADYSAIASVLLKMDNYEGTINFDGPGHSLEFINLYKDQIDQVSGKMIHKKASVVGSILHDIPSVTQEHIATYDVGVFDQHSMKNWVTDEDGQTVPGEQDWYEYLVEKLTRGSDRLPTYMGNSIIYIVNLGIEGFFWAKSFYKEHPEFVNELMQNTLKYLCEHPQLVGAAINVVAKIIVAVAVFAIALILGEILIEALEAFVAAVVERICTTVKWIVDKAVELYDAVKKLVKSISEYLHSKTPGARYASSHPSFRADTSLMREYANQLRAVNGRLNSLDRDLDDLYWQVGLLDVYDILSANIIAGYSPRIGMCRNYLNNAADALEDADRKALGYMGG